MVAVSTGVAGWFGYGTKLTDDGRQQVATRWLELQQCMVGSSPNGALPSKRMEAIRRATRASNGNHDWPQRCTPYATDLDQVLSKPSVRDVIGELRPASAMFAAGTTPVQQGTQLDALWRALRAAELPVAGATRDVPAPPEGMRTLLADSKLSSLGRVAQLDNIAATFDPVSGRVLRLLMLTEQPRLCVLDDGERSVRWRNAMCRDVAVKLEPGSFVRLARAEPGAADLVYARTPKERDGFYDASSGRKLWTPRFAAAQAIVRASGETSILYAEMAGKKKRKRVDAFRLVRFAPGKRPMNARLKIPRTARTLLTATELLWWRTRRDDGRATHDELVAQALRADDEVLGKRRRVGKLPIGSRYVDDCANRSMRAVLFASRGDEPRYALALQRGTSPHRAVDIGVLEGRIDMVCNDSEVVLSRVGDSHVSLWRCNQDGCEHEQTGALPGLGEGTGVAATVGDRLLYVHMSHGLLQMRHGTTEELASAPDQLLFNEVAQGGFDAQELRLIGSGHTGLLLLHGQDAGVYALRISSDGNVEPVAVSP